MVSFPREKSHLQSRYKMKILITLTFISLVRCDVSYIPNRNSIQHNGYQYNPPFSSHQSPKSSISASNSFGGNKKIFFVTSIGPVDQAFGINLVSINKNNNNIQPNAQQHSLQSYQFSSVGPFLNKGITPLGITTNIIGKPSTSIQVPHKFSFIPQYQQISLISPQNVPNIIANQQKQAVQLPTLIQFLINQQKNVPYKLNPIYPAIQQIQSISKNPNSKQILASIKFIQQKPLDFANVHRRFFIKEQYQSPETNQFLSNIGKDSDRGISPVRVQQINQPFHPTSLIQQIPKFENGNLISVAQQNTSVLSDDKITQNHQPQILQQPINSAQYVTETQYLPLPGPVQNFLIPPIQSQKLIELQTDIGKPIPQPILPDTLLPPFKDQILFEIRPDQLYTTYGAPHIPSITHNKGQINSHIKDQAICQNSEKQNQNIISNTSFQQNVTIQQDHGDTDVDISQLIDPRQNSIDNIPSVIPIIHNVLQSTTPAFIQQKLDALPVSSHSGVSFDSKLPSSGYIYQQNQYHPFKF